MGRLIRLILAAIIIIVAVNTGFTAYETVNNAITTKSNAINSIAE